MENSGTQYSQLTFKNIQNNQKLITTTFLLFDKFVQFMTQATGSIWNVNSWHWQSKNYSENSKKILEGKISELTHSIDNNIKISHTKVKFSKAQAEICIRKGKQILVYDFEIEMDVLAENQQEECKGSYRVRQILNDDLNDMIVDEVKMTSKNKCGDQAKKFLKKNAKEGIIKVFKQFQAQLSKMQGDPQKLQEDKKKRQEAVQATNKARLEKGEEKQRLLEEQREKEKKLKQQAYKKNFQKKGQENK